jgi:hypothetical protein
MNDNLTKARRYRDEAENLRILAAQDENISTRERLLTVAGEYDRLYAKYLSIAGERVKPGAPG